MSFRILGYSESRKRIRKPQFPRVSGGLSKEVIKKLLPKPRENRKDKVSCQIG